MKPKLLLAGTLAGMTFLLGCETIPPGAERGPNGTMAYNVAIEASEPGVRIRANGADIGPAPLTLKIYGDPDGTFHDFGSYHYVVQAFPANTNQFVQTKVFRTGHMFSPEDMIPHQIYFDMSQQPSADVPVGYYGPGYYGRGYYGPRVYVGPAPHPWGPGPRPGPGPGPGWHP